MFGAMVPRSKSAEFFGFYNISGKFAGILGPMVFGLVGQFGGTSRLGILSLLFFFVVGGFLLMKVDLDAGKRASRDSNSFDFVEHPSK
jgi:MFS transporter, UMF1 family